jgi:hypothetical protein
MSNEIAISEQESAAGADQHDHGLPVGQAASGHDLTKNQIERIRDTDIDRYFAEGLDRRLLQMTKEELGQTQATDPMPVELSRSLMCETPEGAQLVSSLDRMGGFKMQLQRLQSAVGGLVRGLGDDRQQRAFMARFDRSIPEPVRYVIYDALATGGPSFIQPVASSDIKKFAATGVGAELVKEWGTDAGSNVATVWKRIAMLRDALGEDAMADFYDWFEDLPPAQIKAVTRFIAGNR